MRTEPGLHPLLVLFLAPFAGALVTLSLAPFGLWPAGDHQLRAVRLPAVHLQRARGYLAQLAVRPGHVRQRRVLGLCQYPRLWRRRPGAGHLSYRAVLRRPGILFQVSFGWFYVRFVRPLPGGMLVGFPVTWVLSEWLRSWLLTGFPWLYLGYAHIDTPISGWAPVVGVYGLSFICAMTGICLFLAWRSRQAIACTTYAVIVITLWAGGAVLKPIEWVVKASEQPLIGCHLPAQRAAGTQVGPGLVPAHTAPAARGQRALLRRRHPGLAGSGHSQFLPARPGLPATPLPSAPPPMKPPCSSACPSRRNRARATTTA